MDPKRKVLEDIRGFARQQQVAPPVEADQTQMDEGFNQYPPNQLPAPSSPPIVGAPPDEGPGVWDQLGSGLKKGYRAVRDLIDPEAHERLNNYTAPNGQTFGLSESDLDQNPSAVDDLALRYPDPDAKPPPAPVATEEPPEDLKSLNQDELIARYMQLKRLQGTGEPGL